MKIGVYKAVSSQLVTNDDFMYKESLFNRAQGRGLKGVKSLYVDTDNWQLVNGRLSAEELRLQRLVIPWDIVYVEALSVETIQLINRPLVIRRPRPSSRRRREANEATPGPLFTSSKVLLNTNHIL